MGLGVHGFGPRYSTLILAPVGVGVALCAAGGRGNLKNDLHAKREAGGVGKGGAAGGGGECAFCDEVICRGCLWGSVGSGLEGMEGGEVR